MTTLFISEEFEKVLSSLDRSEQLRIEKIIVQLKNQGENVGKPLRYPLREKKLGSKRLYFIFYNNSILVITISNKKDQQFVIDKIISNIDIYKLLIDKLKENPN